MLKYLTIAGRVLCCALRTARSKRIISIFKKYRLLCAELRATTIIAYTGRREEVLMPVDYNALGSRIAHYRGKLNLSQEKLTEQVNLSREYINKIEEQILTKTAQELKKILYGLGI